MGTKISFEKHLSELENIVEQLENGDIPLEKLIVQYEVGMKHLIEAQKILKDAELRIEQLKVTQNNGDEMAPFALDTDNNN